MLRDRLRAWEANTKLKKAAKIETGTADGTAAAGAETEPTRDLNTSAENVYQRQFLNTLDAWYDVSWARKQKWATAETPSSATLVDFAEIASIAINTESRKVCQPVLRPLRGGAVTQNKIYAFFHTLAGLPCVDGRDACINARSHCSMLTSDLHFRIGLALP